MRVRSAQISMLVGQIWKGSVFRVSVPGHERAREVINETPTGYTHISPNDNISFAPRLELIVAVTSRAWHSCISHKSERAFEVRCRSSLDRSWTRTMHGTSRNLLHDSSLERCMTLVINGWVKFWRILRKLLKGVGCAFYIIILNKIYFSIFGLRTALIRIQHFLELDIILMKVTFTWFRKWKYRKNKARFHMWKVFNDILLRYVKNVWEYMYIIIFLWRFHSCRLKNKNLYIFIKELS